VRLIYAPEGGERQEWSFRPNELLSPEAEAMEDAGPWGTFEEFGRRFMSGNLRARRAALWVMLRRADPALRLSDLVVRVDELDVEYEPDEIDRLRTLIETNAFLTDDERAEALALLEQGEAPPEASEFAAGKGRAGVNGSASP